MSFAFGLLLSAGTGKSLVLVKMNVEGLTLIPLQTGCYAKLLSLLSY
jgi:hypothetical protein